jgi:endonuclease/exonuclease/phosphatase family metal-dependent hydrolase
MTWNLWWRFGDWRRRQERIERVLQDTRPDLVGLQEVWGTAAETQAQRLADDLGMHHAWVASPAPEFYQRRIGDSAVDVGNAVLSRWPITGTSAADLPSGNGDAGRTAILACIYTPVGTISFATTQLSSVVGASTLRCAQVRALAAFIARESASDALHPHRRP